MHTKTILTPNELYRIYLFINDAILNVRIGGKIEDDILSAIEICQDECLSALVFIFYLAHTVKSLPLHRQVQDYQKPPRSALDWIIDRDRA